MRESELFFTSSLPKFSFDQCLLIYDRRLLKQCGKWIQHFPHAYGVQSGERLKDLTFFSEHVHKLLRKSSSIAPKDLTVVGFGGGSVGDFAGFFASVFKRGVRFEQVPSTWLAALDSAHGGKTALNVQGFKNQIGTFYPASKVHLVREVLQELNEKRFREAWPEAVKVALLQGPELLRKVSRADDSARLWKLLPQLIEAKLRVVRLDPEEKSGVRHLLNLGHTLGHVIESELGLAHGLAIGYGTRFALQWSEVRFDFPLSKYESELRGLPSASDLRKVLGRLKNVRRALNEDKKKSGRDQVRFIFLKDAGRSEIESVGLDQILAEVLRQQE